MKRWLLRTALLLFIMGGSALYIGLSYYDLIKIEKVECEASALPFADQLGLVDSIYNGISVYDFPADSLLSAIVKQNPQVCAARFDFAPTGEISFSCSYKKPCLLLSLDRVYGLSPAGELILPESGDYPILSGLESKQARLYRRLRTSQLSYAMKIARIMKRFPDSLYQSISIIDLNHPSGLALYLENCPAEIILGRGDEDQKFARVNYLLDFLRLLGRDVQVDLRFSNQLVLKHDSAT